MAALIAPWCQAKRPLVPPLPYRCLGVSTCIFTCRIKLTRSIMALPGCFLFGVIPAFHAQVMHLFTDRITYTVSFKPAAIIPGLASRRDAEKSLA